MIELQRHIEILLLTNDCVIVPGLGGFMAHHIDARFDAEDNTFVPPLRTLGFNQSLTMNDSLLVQSYIESYDISYPEALRRIENEVEELRQHLQAEGYYELNDIGVLSLNGEGNIAFTPCEAGILTPSLYGLGTFEMQPLATPGETKAATAAAAPADEQEEEPQQPKPEVVDEEQEHAIVIKMSWLRNAVAVAAAIVAFFIVSTPVSNSDIASQPSVQQSSFIPIAAQSETAEDDKAMASPAVETAAGAKAGETAAETVKSEASASATTAVSTAGVTEPSAAPAASSVAEQYCIVLASQVSQKNADGFVEQLAKKGFNDAYVTNAKFRRVVYGHYPTKDEAVSQLRQLRQQDSRLFGEGWVMKSEK